jgi:hypothetical protein
LTNEEGRQGKFDVAPPLQRNGRRHCRRIVAANTNLTPAKWPPVPFN